MERSESNTHSKNYRTEVKKRKKILVGYKKLGKSLSRVKKNWGRFWLGKTLVTCKSCSHFLPSFFFPNTIKKARMISQDNSLVLLLSI